MLLAALVLLGAAATDRAHASLCNFDDDLDPLCASQGLTWINLGGQPTRTDTLFGQPSHSGDHAIYNNFNAPIGVQFAAASDIDYLWMTDWAGFPANTVTITGLLGGSFIDSIVVTLGNFNYQQYFLGSSFDNVDELRFSPSHPAVSVPFGTFAIDDVSHQLASSTVPEPATLSLVGFGLAGLGLAIRRRRG